MSRFSKAEAEARGWAFAHSSDEENIVTSETQGETRVRPTSVRAEKTLSGGGMINEEAETLGKLLERIAAYEAHLEQKTVEQTPVPVNVDAVPTIRLPAPDAPGENVGQDTGAPIRTVLLPGDETITEEDLVSRSRSDAILKGDEMIFHGPRPHIEEFEAERAAYKQDVEDARTEEEDVGPTEVIDIDDSQSVVDLPGGRTGSSIVVREGETLDDVAERREAESADAEATKSLRAALPESEQAAEDAATEDAEAPAEEQPEQPTPIESNEPEQTPEPEQVEGHPAEPVDGGEPE